MHPLLSSGIFTKNLTLKRNEVLKEQGTIDTNIYYIKSGSLKISVYTNGEEQIIRFGYTGNIIVSLDSFITGQRSDFVIQAIKKSELLVASKNDFMEYVYQSEQNLVMYTKMLEDLVVQQLTRERDLLIQSPRERFESLFARNPKLFQLIPNRHIANYLRMSPETLSRLQKP